MKDPISPDHPLRRMFHQAVQDALRNQLGMRGPEEVELYLRDLLVRFLTFENVFAIRDAEGHPVRTMAEMLLEADVRFRANSFEREREVHRHIGDLILFHAGFFPEHLDKMASVDPVAGVKSPVRQGQESYYVVSTFRHGKYSDEAPLFERLSGRFEAYCLGLSIVRDRLTNH